MEKIHKREKVARSWKRFTIVKSFIHQGKDSKTWKVSWNKVKIHKHGTFLFL